MSRAAGAASTPSGTAAAQVKLNELFMQWLSSSDGVECTRKELLSRAPALASALPRLDEMVVPPTMMTDRFSLFTEIDSDILLRRRNSLFPPAPSSRSPYDGPYTPSPSPSRDRVGGSGPVLSPPRSPQSSPRVGSPFRARASSPLLSGAVGAVDELDVRARRRASPSTMPSPAAGGSTPTAVEGSPASARRPMSPISSPATMPSRAALQSRLLASAASGEHSPSHTSPSYAGSGSGSPESTAARRAGEKEDGKAARSGSAGSSSSSTTAVPGKPSRPTTSTSVSSAVAATAVAAPPPASGAAANVPTFFRPLGPPPSEEERSAEIAAMAALFPSVPSTYFSTRPPAGAAALKAAPPGAGRTAGKLSKGSEQWQNFVRKVCGLPRVWHRVVWRRVAAFSVGAVDVLKHPALTPRHLCLPPAPLSPSAAPDDGAAAAAAAVAEAEVQKGVKGGGGVYVPEYGRCTAQQAAKAADVTEIDATVARAWYWAYCAEVRKERRLFEMLRGSGAGKDRDSTGCLIVPKEAVCAPRGVPLLWFSDFFEVLQDLVELHPGLAFLESTPEFQVKYVETVAYRIVFSLAKCTASWLTFSDFTQYDNRLPRSFITLDDQADVNAVTDFFSYEHYYVIYCRFWEIDKDHDFVITLEDLAAYAPSCLNSRALERVVAGAGRPIAAIVPGTMCYRDFVWFCLAEEDKAARTSVEYWFRILDVNGDGKLDLDELAWFWEGMVVRIREQGCEPIKYFDVLKQMLDMVAFKSASIDQATGAPKADPLVVATKSEKDVKGGAAEVVSAMQKAPGVRLAQLQRCPFPADFLNVYINARKFLDFEYKDPYREHSLRASMPSDWGSVMMKAGALSSHVQNREGGMLVVNVGREWERFARREYDRMAEEAGEGED